MAESPVLDSVDALFAHEPRLTAQIILDVLYARDAPGDPDPEQAILRADLEAVVFRHQATRAPRLGDRADREHLARYLATAEAHRWPQELAVTSPLGPRLRALVAEALARRD